MTGGCHGTIVSPLASRVAFSVKLREMRSTGPSRLRQESGSPGGFPSEADRLPCQSKKCQQQVGRGVPPSRGMSLIAFLDAALIGPAIRHGNVLAIRTLSCENCRTRVISVDEHKTCDDRHLEQPEYGTSTSVQELARGRKL